MIKTLGQKVLGTVFHPVQTINEVREKHRVLKARRKAAKLAAPARNTPRRAPGTPATPTRRPLPNPIRAIMPEEPLTPPKKLGNGSAFEFGVR